MNRRLLLIFGLLFGALVVIAVLQTRQANQPTEETFELSFIGQDLNMTANDIQAVRLRDLQNDYSLTISRDADGNWIAPEIEGSLDPDAASGIVRTMVLLPYQRVIPLEETTDLTQYGFGETSGTLAAEILLKDSTSHAIVVGGVTPTGLQYYTLIDDLPQVFFIERGAVDFLLALLAKPPLT